MFGKPAGDDKGFASLPVNGQLLNLSKVCGQQQLRTLRFFGGRGTSTAIGAFCPTLNAWKLPETLIAVRRRILLIQMVSS
jgi:hypothetical protein